jgi:hypothetical protein
MSKLGLKNLIQASKFGHVIRAELLRRDEETFFDDAGELPLTPVQVYERTVEEGMPRECRFAGRGRHSRWIYVDGPVAIGTDCNRAFESGLLQHQIDMQGYADERDEYYESRYDNDGCWFDPVESIWDAWQLIDQDAEICREAQWMQWEELQQSGPHQDDIPLWFSRVAINDERGTW